MKVRQLKIPPKCFSGKNEILKFSKKIILKFLVNPLYSLNFLNSEFKNGKDLA